MFWNFWIDDIKLAEICLKLGVSAEEEPLKEDLQNILKKAEAGDAIMLLLRREANGRSQDFIVTLSIPE